MTDETPDPFRRLPRRSVLLGALALGACSARPDNIIGVRAPGVDASAIPGRKEHRIYVMTTRALDADASLMFNNKRGDSLSFAAVTVGVPPNHQSGKVERPRAVPPDPEKEFTIDTPTHYNGEKAFVQALRAELATRALPDLNLMVFVHGYNTSLAEAIMRMGQFVHDTGYSGVAVLFSWASAGRLRDYVYDLNSVLAARDDLLRGTFLLSQTQAKFIDVVAHSMGNLLTVEALRQAKLQGNFGKTGRLRYVILASPDIDADLFRRELSVFPANERRFYVMISRDDGVLRFSRMLAGGVPRVGNDDLKNLAELGVTVIDLSEIHDSGSNHAKFASSPEIVQLIGERLRVDGPMESHQPSLVEAIVTLPIQVVAATVQ